MSTSYDIVMDNRKRILDELIASLEKGSIFPTELSFTSFFMEGDIEKWQTCL